MHLTKRELDLMSVIWELGSATVADVQDRLQDDLAYSTVLTLLRTLEHKGHVRHEKDGKAFRYFPLIEPDDAGDSALKRLVNKVYKGSRELLIARLVAAEDVSPEELERIREQVNRRLEEMDR
jgi:predicted transcriptional regulator